VQVDVGRGRGGPSVLRPTVGLARASRQWDSPFKRFVDQDRDVVGQDLAQEFVHLGGRILRTERFAQLLLDRGERGLDVPPLWILLSEYHPPPGD
jgi:hypothetical protein